MLLTSPTLSLQMPSGTRQLHQYKFYQNHNHQAVPECKAFYSPLLTRLPLSRSSSKENFRFQDNEDFELK